jgi:hypothetical protein
VRLVSAACATNQLGWEAALLNLTMQLHLFA